MPMQVNLCFKDADHAVVGISTVMLSSFVVFAVRWVGPVCAQLQSHA